MRIIGLLAIFTCALILSACGGGSTAATPTKAAGVSSGSTSNLSGSTSNSSSSSATTPDAAKPTATAEAKATATTKAPSSSSSSSSSSTLFSDVPDYPGATTQGSFDFAGLGLDASDEYEKTEWRALGSKDSPDKIVKFYKEELVKAKNGWIEEGWFESAGTGGLGAYSKDNENKSLALIIGKEDGDAETSIILAVAEGKKKK